MYKIIIIITNNRKHTIKFECLLIPRDHWLVTRSHDFIIRGLIRPQRLFRTAKKSVRLSVHQSCVKHPPHSTSLPVIIINKPNLHHIHSQICGFVLLKHTHTYTQRRACVRLCFGGPLRCVCLCDQLDRAMVSITCSSLDLSLCLRDCSSRSRADRISSLYLVM